MEERIAIVYATREGHTEQIAERLALALRAQGVPTDLYAAGELSADFTFAGYAGAVVAASVHLGRHEPEIVAFVRAHRDELVRVRAALVSVSLSEAGAEDDSAPPERRIGAHADVRAMVERFVADTGWRPHRVEPVAGALVYRRYNPLVQPLMRWVALRAGGDPIHDHDYTDWSRLERFADELAAEVTADRWFSAIL